MPRTMWVSFGERCNDWDRIWNIHPRHGGNGSHYPGHSEVSERFETHTDTQSLNISLVLKCIRNWPAA